MQDARDMQTQAATRLGVDPFEPAAVVVNPSATSAQTNTFVRDALLLIGALPAIVAIVGSRDTGKIVSYLASEQGLQIAGVVLSAGVIAYRQWAARRERARLVLAATSRPNSTVVIAGTTQAAQAVANRDAL